MRKARKTMAVFRALFVGCRAFLGLLVVPQGFENRLPEGAGLLALHVAVKEKADSGTE